MYKSPFNGDQIKISIKVSRNYFNKNKEKYEGFEYNPERGCDTSEYFTTMVNGEGEFLLIKEQRD